MKPQEDNVSRQSRSAVFVVIERRIGDSLFRTSTANMVEGYGRYLLSSTGLQYRAPEGGMIEVYAE
jgi:hypothetical protein